MTWRGVIAEFKNHLPINANTKVISLNEGNTPLIPAESLSQITGAKVFLKYEGLNPTGSFKDRGMVMAVTKAVTEGAKTIMCASTGNTSASAAAYAARSGLRCIVLIPDGNIALGKLAQAIIYGAEVIAINGNFDEALTIVRTITEKEPITLVNSINPFRIEGQKTAAFEVCEQLGGKAPDYVVIPVGNAGNITAYWKGFKEYFQEGQVRNTPAMLGFQAAGAAPIVTGVPVEKPETVATAIRIGNPASWQGALNALTESKGAIDSVTDEEILAAYRLLASQEGIFVEPASAASVAGLLKKAKSHKFRAEDKIVCVLTGNGLKDPDNAIKVVTKKPALVEASYEAVLEAIM